MLTAPVKIPYLASVRSCVFLEKTHFFPYFGELNTLEEKWFNWLSQTFTKHEITVRTFLNVFGAMKGNPRIFTIGVQII